MRIYKQGVKTSVLFLAIQSALAAMFALPALADEEDMAALVYPASYLDLGMGTVSSSSAKFGEYNGMNKNGGFMVGGFSVQGGNSYGDNVGTARWLIKGDDLGLTTRSFTSSYKNQGSWSIGLGYDELQHNFTDTYQSPYLGNMGGNYFVLAPGFGTAANTRTLSAGQQALLLPVDVYTSRKNSKFTVGANLSAQWSIMFDINHLEQAGAKLRAFGSMAGGGATGEAISILPDPTNYTTDNLNLALNWLGEKGSMTAAYAGSYFKDAYNAVSFQTFAGANNMQIMSTAPSNAFHQFNLTGGYAFSQATRLTAGYSYGRTTQNDDYAVDSISMVSAAPRSSADALVVTTHADVKLTSQAARNLMLSAMARYDERNNKTESNFYYFNALDGAVNHQAYFPNTPYSNSKGLLELAGEYRLSSDQHLKVAYDREWVKRWCENYAVGGLGTSANWNGNNTYPAGTNCVVAPSSIEDKVGASYRMRASEVVNFHLGYSLAKRMTASDSNAITARIGLNGNDPSLPASQQIMGLNAGDFPGFYPAFDATRTEQIAKAGLNWQTSEKLSMGLLGRITEDKYDNSYYGVQNGHSWSLSLDSSYSYSENASVSVYATQQQQQHVMTDFRSSTTGSWTDTLQNEDTTFGVGGRQNGLANSRLELTEDMTYSMANAQYGTVLNYTSTPACSSSTQLTCGALPPIKNNVLQFKLTGKYKLSKASRLSLGYIFQQMESSDYYYNGLQYGFTPTRLMATNQQAPNYTVNVLAAAYSFNF